MSASETTQYREGEEHVRRLSQ